MLLDSNAVLLNYTDPARGRETCYISAVLRDLTTNIVLCDEARDCFLSVSCKGYMKFTSIPIERKPTVKKKGYNLEQIGSFTQKGRKNY